ncbi:MAG: NAD-dependent epimerase/dehydratase family protein [Victivallaceae bacterium]
MTIRTGITGCRGFIGAALARHLECHPAFEVADSPFDAHRRDAFAAGCEVIVHLAGVSRGEDGAALYATNVGIVRELIATLERVDFRGRVLLGSTTHIGRDTPYHASKREGARLLAEWAARRGGSFTALLMPNAFGPGSKPFYNSVVSTFSAQLRAGETPVIPADADLALIDIQSLCAAIAGIILAGPDGRPEIAIDPVAALRLSELKEKLQTFRDRPETPLSGRFENALYQTYYSYPENIKR